MALLGSQNELDRIRHNAYIREYKKKNKERINALQRKGYRKKLGLTEEDVDKNKKERMNYARRFSPRGHSKEET